jgi:hypothetical protein
VLAGGPPVWIYITWGEVFGGGVGEKGVEELPIVCTFPEERMTRGGFRGGGVIITGVLGKLEQFNVEVGWRDTPVDIAPVEFGKSKLLLLPPPNRGDEDDASIPRVAP